jgi:hypothetical protein
MCGRRFHILSILLAVGAFFLPFLALPLTRARCEKAPRDSMAARAAENQGERPLSPKKADQEFERFRDEVRGDAALGIF